MKLRLRHLRAAAFCAGLMDGGTGLALLVAPALTLSLMGVEVPVEAALPFVRFVGCFVGAVGLCYLMAFRGSSEQFREMLATTRVFRLAAGAFTLVSVLTGSMEGAWLLVSGTDLGLVIAQTWALRRKDLWIS